MYFVGQRDDRMTVSKYKDTWTPWIALNYEEFWTRKSLSKYRDDMPYRSNALYHLRHSGIG